MDYAISIKGLREKMKTKPKYHKMYSFFLGTPGQLTKEEVKEIKKIVANDHKKLITFLDKAKTL